jgi:hypothetical protein
MLDELATLVETHADAQLPAARLRAAIDLSRDLSDLGDAVIERVVVEARAAGMSWTEIGQVFGTSKQAVQQRYGTTSDRPGRLPGRWSPVANDALNRAGQVARELGHGHVGTEHLLLTLVTTERGIAAEVLRDLGVAPDRILSTSCVVPGARIEAPPEGVAVMPRLKQALEHSRRIADGLDVRTADTEHLLAGIVAVSDSMAVEILRRLGVSAADVRAALADRMNAEPQQLGAPRRRRRRRRLLAAGR